VGTTCGTGTCSSLEKLGEEVSKFWSLSTIKEELSRRISLFQTHAMGSEMCIKRKHHSSDVRQDKNAKVKTLKHPPTKISTRGTGILLEPRPRPLFLESGFSIEEKRFLDLLAIPSPTANAKNKNKKKDCFEETSIAKEAKSILAGIIASHQSQRKMGVTQSFKF
jgi:hypothetical protein